MLTSVVFKTTNLGQSFPRQKAGGDQSPTAHTTATPASKDSWRRKFILENRIEKLELEWNVVFVFSSWKILSLYSDDFRCETPGFTRYVREAKSFCVKCD